MKTNFERLKTAQLKNVTWNDIFASQEYRTDIQSIAETACEKVGFKSEVTASLLYEKDNEDVAWTDGRTIYINMESDFSSRLKNNPVLFHIFVVGNLAHELGHVFWTDFDDNKLYMSSLSKGKIYPEVPNHKNAEKFCKALKNRKYRSFIIELLHMLDNIIEDIYVNDMQRKTLGGIYAQGINIFNVLVAENGFTVEQQIANGNDDLSIIINCLLQTLKSESAFYGAYEGKYKAIVDYCASLASQYVFKPSHKERLMGVNLIVCELWGYVEKMLKQANNAKPSQKGATSQGATAESDEEETEDSEDEERGSGGSDNGSEKSDNLSSSDEDSEENENENASSESEQSDDTEDEEDEAEVEKRLNEALDKLINSVPGQTTESRNAATNDVVPNNGNSENKAKPELSDILKKDLNRSQSGQSQSAGEIIDSEAKDSSTLTNEYVESGKKDAVNTLKKVIDSLCSKGAELENERSCLKILENDCSNMDFDSHRTISIDVIRPSTFDVKSKKKKYDLILKKVSELANSMIKVIERNLKEERLTGERRGRYYGKYLDTSKLYRTDLKNFKDKKQPKKEIDLAVSLLVDLSLSMTGSRVHYALISSILFAEICQRMNIPVEINGHNVTSVNRVNIFNYMNFDSCNQNEKYRLMDMSVDGCNRDGAAFIFSAERLARRKEQKKLFIIISDGLPNDLGYSGDAAIEDLKHLKNVYSRKGLNIVAAAIGDDKQTIQKIYGKDFLDISNLSEMPKAFAKILKNEILK